MLAHGKLSERGQRVAQDRFTIERFQADLDERLPEDIDTAPLEELQRAVSEVAEAYAIRCRLRLRCTLRPRGCELVLECDFEV